MSKSLYTRILQEIPPSPQMPILQLCQENIQINTQCSNVIFFIVGRCSTYERKNEVTESNDGQVEFLLDVLGIL